MGRLPIDENTRAVQGVVSDVDGITPVPVQGDPNTGAVNTRLYDSEMLSTPHISHFGALKAASTIPVIKGNFPGTSLNTKTWTQAVSSGGNIVVEDGVGKLKTSTDAAGSIKLKSKQKGQFEAGQVTVYQSGVYAGVGVADNIRRWGLMTQDEQNGLFFELNGTAFRVVARKAGTDTAVASTSFSGDTAFTPGASNNTYRIHYSAGRALFQRANNGRITLLHRMVDTQLPLVDDLDMGLYYENTNTGNTTDIELRVRGASASVFGDLRRFNEGGAQIVGDFGTEVARGLIDNYEIVTQFGRNPEIDTTTDPEDVWNGGGNYTGFDATGNENIEVLSSSTNDVGIVESSGTATAGDETSLTDSGATFVTDGVTTGDILVNDTQKIHGVITAITETVATVFNMVNGPAGALTNAEGDSYRIVSTNGTGAALVKVEQLLDEDYMEQDPEYVVLNGTTGVTVTGNYMRCSQARVILAGSGGINAGTITVRQETSTTNVFLEMPTSGQGTVTAYTVPANKNALIKRLRIAITRASGAAGSATVSMRIRRRGEVFVAPRSFEVQTGSPTEFTQVGADVIPAGTDIKLRIDQVSDNDTIIDGAIEFFLVDAQ